MKEKKITFDPIAAEEARITQQRFIESRKTDSGNMVRDCILFKGSRESRIIGACLWLFFLIWLSGMTIAFWAAYNGCTHKI